MRLPLYSRIDPDEKDGRLRRDGVLCFVGLRTGSELGIEMNTDLKNRVKSRRLEKKKTEQDTRMLYEMRMVRESI